MKYPKTTREQNRACKLSDENIADIRFMYGTGESIASLARKFDVSWTAIKRWVNEDYRVKCIKSSSLWYKLNPPTDEQKKKYKRTHRENKIEDFGKDIKKYYSEKVQTWRENNRDKIIARRKELKALKECRP